MLGQRGCRGTSFRVTMPAAGSDGTRIDSHLVSGEDEDRRRGLADRCRCPTGGQAPESRNQLILCLSAVQCPAAFEVRNSALQSRLRVP